MAADSKPTGAARIVPSLDPAPLPEHPRGLGTDSGPHPVLRAAVGLAVGLAAGAVAASVIPRPDRAARAAAVRRS